MSYFEPPSAPAAPTATQPPPGWYADPGGMANTQRYWDGRVWTDKLAPGATSPVGSSSDSTTMAMLAHLSALGAGLVGLAFIGPLVIYLIKRDQDPYVRAHAAEALNFQLSWLIWLVVGVFAMILLTLVLVGLLLIPVLIAGGIAWLVLTIVASVKASRGEAFRYPLTIRFVD